ncbi:MAG: S9 family peptidase [Longimicrobiales bacterium]
MRVGAPARLMILALLALPSAVAAQQSDRLTLGDYLDYETVSSPQLSPDGAEIVYARRWVDKVNDSWESSLYIMNADGTRPRALVDGGNPIWSPDGTRIAYTARGEPGGTQIWVRWMDAEGAATQVTRLSDSPNDLAWSPDGKWIAFRMLVPANNAWPIESKLSPFKPKGAQWTEAPRLVQKLNYRRDRVGFIGDGTQHLFIVPADGGTPRQVTSGDHDAGAPQWMPDGRTIVFSSAPRVEDSEYLWRQSDIYALDVNTGVIRQLTTRDGPDSNPTVSPDGRWIAYTGYDSANDSWIETKLYVMAADGSGQRLLTGDLDRSVRSLKWAPDNSGIYFDVQSEGAENLYFAPLNGSVRQVTEGAHMLSVEMIGRGGLAVGTRSAPHETGDIVAFNVRRPDDVRKLTDVNGDILAGKRLGAVEELWYEGADGWRVQGWLVKPPDFNPSQRYPLMLAIHGGPHSMYNVGFNFAFQEHAANGYLVLYTNPRGSTGYGAEFGNAIQNAYPSKDFDDLMAGVDAVIAQGIVDEDRMYVYGCSGGGVLTSWTVGHTNRFAAASANCPVTNWLSFVGTTDGSSWYRNFEKLPWEDPSEHLRRSPLMYVGNVTTPTMLMTGVNDLRTPMSQTEEYYQALKLRKVPTAMVRFNDEWHGTSSNPSNFLRTQLYLREWFSRYTKNDAPRAEQQ